MKVFILMKTNEDCPCHDLISIHFALLELYPVLVSKCLRPIHLAPCLPFSFKVILYVFAFCSREGRKKRVGQQMQMEGREEGKGLEQRLATTIIMRERG